MITHRSSVFAAICFGLALTFSFPGLRAETLPDRRPALVGSGPKSLVNLIDAEALYRKGQRDAWVMFECSVAPDGISFGSDFFTASPSANLLKDEVRRRLRQAKFIPAVYDHKRTYAFFDGTAVFVVANGKPHLRVYAHQELDEIRHGTDFVAPQLIGVPNHDVSNFPDFPSGFVHMEEAAIVKLRHSVDANGKTTDVQVISEVPAGHRLGEWLKKAPAG